MSKQLKIIIGCGVAIVALPIAISIFIPAVQFLLIVSWEVFVSPYLG